MKYSWKWARFRISSCCRSIENCWTWPSRKLASGVPVLAAVVASVGRLVNRLLNVNWPVGDGGCTTLSRSQRRSAPTLTVCRPFSQVSVVGDLGHARAEVRGRARRRPELLIAADEERRHACSGIVRSTECREGPGSPRPCRRAGRPSRPTVRLVSPMRSSFTTLFENVRW